MLALMDDAHPKTQPEKICFDVIQDQSKENNEQ